MFGFLNNNMVKNSLIVGGAFIGGVVAYKTVSHMVSFVKKIRAEKKQAASTPEQPTA